MRQVNAKAYKKGWKQFEDWSNFPGKMLNIYTYFKTGFTVTIFNVLIDFFSLTFIHSLLYLEQIVSVVVFSNFKNNIGETGS